MSYRWGECCGCLDMGLLKRVQIWPGMISETETYHVNLCLHCRVSWRDDGYACLAESLKFNRVARAEWRAAREGKKKSEGAHDEASQALERQGVG